MELCGSMSIYGDTKVFEFYSLILIHSIFIFDIIGPGVLVFEMFEYSTTAIAGSQATVTSGITRNESTRQI